MILTSLQAKVLRNHWLDTLYAVMDYQMQFLIHLEILTEYLKKRNVTKRISCYCTIVLSPRVKGTSELCFKDSLKTVMKYLRRLVSPW